MTEGPTLATALRFAVRALRGTVARAFRGFGIFVACLALGVGTIAGVSSLGRAFDAALSAEGDAILGGDVAFSLNHRPITPDQRAFLAARGRLSEVATLRAMARTVDGAASTLVEAKAVDATWPLTARATLADGSDARVALAPLSTPDGPRATALVEEGLLARLRLAVGDDLVVGTGRLRIAGVIGVEPDRLASGIGFGPRLLMTTEALEATGLLAPGSLVRWHARLSLPDGADAARLAAVLAEVDATFPAAGWEVRTRADAAPGTRATIDRFVQFLTLVGLTTLVIGGVGVANAVVGHLERRRETIAVWRSLGATGRFVFAVHAFEIGAVALLGIALGLAFGAAVPLVLAGPIGDALDLALPPVFAGRELALAALEGALTAALFVVRPLARAVATPPATLFRDTDPPARAWRHGLVPALAIGAILVALVIATAPDRRITPPYLAVTALALVGLQGLAAALIAALRRLPRPGLFEARTALAAMVRPGAPTAAIMLSIGLGTTLVVALVQIEQGLTRAIADTLPGRAPSFFFLDVPARDADPFRAFLAEKAVGARIEDVPFLRGRITALKGVPVEKAEVAENVRFVLAGDRGVTFSAEPPPHSIITEGAWWPASHAGPPQVSFDADTAAGLGLRIGDTVTVNVLGRDVEARIANFRKIEWNRLAINFFMVFSPDAFRGAPVTRLATVTWDGGGDPAAETVLLKAVVERFPVVTAVRVRDALAQVDQLVRRSATGVSVVAAFAVFAAVLVLAGSLTARAEARIRDAAVLVAIGAPRRRLLAALALEFTLISLIASAFAAGLGTLAADHVLTRIMRLPFDGAPGLVALLLLGTTLVTVSLGLLSTRSALRARPADVLRAT